MYGIQTDFIAYITQALFENDVKMYGIQTSIEWLSEKTTFENDVKMYGIQTVPCIKRVHYSLRMM